MGEFDHTETTTKIYKSDVALLKQWQRQVSAQRQAWVTLPELLHEIIHEKAAAT